MLVFHGRRLALFHDDRVRLAAIAGDAAGAIGYAVPA
jgi:hypothetical protein